MAKSQQALRMLRPNGGWVMNGDDYEGIQFFECEPFTKAEFNAALKKVDVWQAEQDATKAAIKAAAQAKLAALGLTVEDLQALGL
jgi:hypothetical protein